MSIIRSDSRTEADVRSLTMRMSLLSRSDGSAEFSFGDLKALGAVTGPAEVRLRDEKPTEATVEVNVVPVIGLPGASNSLKLETRKIISTRPPSKALAHSIKVFFSHLILLKKYPRSLIQINLQTLSKPSNQWTQTFSTSTPDESPVMAFDESQSVTEKAALINAASLALLDSGVCMRGCGFAIGVAIIPASSAQSVHPDQSPESDQVVLDPNPTEEASAKSLHLVGFHYGYEFNTSISSDEVTLGQATLCESNGVFDYEELQKVLKYASLAAQQILAFARRSCESTYPKVTTSQVQSNPPPPPHSTTDEHLNSSTAEEKRKRKKSKKTK